MKLINCPCSKQSNAFSDNGETAFCYTCGFKTTEQEKIETLPQIYQDLAFTDENRRIFIPSVLNMPEKGVCFMDGTSINDVKWKVVKNVPILEEEKDKFPKEATTKPDFNNAKEFDRYNWMDAADEIDFFKK